MGRRDLKESGACVPLGEGCVLLSAMAASKAAAAKRRPRRRQEFVRPSEGGRQLQSHPRPSPADGRLKASDFIGRGAGHRYETARYRRRPLR